MKYTVLGDLHCKPDNLDKIERIFDIVEERCNSCIILGDVFDTKELIRGRCLNTIYRRLESSTLKFHILVGNHDLFNLDSDEHALTVFNLLKNVNIIENVFDMSTDITLFGYKHDKDKIKALLEEHRSGLRTIFGHFDISDFDYGNGRLCSDGLSPEDFGDIQVISGHYHGYQHRGNIMYLGTPFSHDFGESNQTKYIGVFDTDTHKMELIETKFPRHLTHLVDLTRDTPGNSFFADDGNIHRVILKGTQEQIDMFKNYPGVKRIEQPVQMAGATKALINESMSFESQFEVWATKIKGYSKEITNLGLDILKKAKQ